MHVTSVRTLTRDYRFTTSSDELAEWLALLEACPEMVGFDLERIEMPVETADGGFIVRWPDGAVNEGNAMSIAANVYKRVLLDVQIEAPGAPIIHAASITAGGRRVLMLGPSGTGKSTLCLHLLAVGFAIEGDDHVVLRTHDLVARPRRMGVRDGSLRFVPGIADAVARCPIVDDGEIKSYLVDPSIAGRPWEIRAGGVDHLVFLESNFGAESSLTPLEREQAFEAMLLDGMLPEVGQGAAIARMRRLVVEKPCWRLRLGDLPEAEAFIRDLLSV